MENWIIITAGVLLVLWLVYGIRYYACDTTRLYKEAMKTRSPKPNPPSHGFNELLKAKKSAAYWYQEYHDLREAMRGAQHPCPDEKHCSCVPLLQGVISTLRKELIWAATKLLDLDEITFTRACEMCMLTQDEMKMAMKKAETEK